MGTESSRLDLFKTYRENINKNHKEKIELDILRARIECMKIVNCPIVRKSCHELVDKYENSVT